MQDTGLFGIYLVCEEDKVEDAVKYSLENILRCSYGITDEEVRSHNTLLNLSVCLFRFVLFCHVLLMWVGVLSFDCSVRYCLLRWLTCLPCHVIA